MMIQVSLELQKKTADFVTGLQFGMQVKLATLMLKSQQLVYADKKVTVSPMR